MARTTTAISVRGDRDYAISLLILAKDLGKPVADIVREAIDARHGGSLAGIAAAFNASRGKPANQRKRK